MCFIRSKIWFCALLAASLIIMSSSPVVAGTNLLVSPGRITASAPLTPGRSYTLPAHEITNGTSRDMDVTVSVSDHRDDVRELPSAEWFLIEPTKFRVPANSTGNTQVLVNLPEDAPAGQYRVWFRFEAIPVGATGMVLAPTIQVSLVFDVKMVSTNSEPENKDEPEAMPAVVSNESRLENGKDVHPPYADKESRGFKQADDAASDKEQKQQQNPQDEDYGFPWAGTGAGLVVIGIGGWFVYSRRQNGR